MSMHETEYGEFEQVELGEAAEFEYEAAEFEALGEFGEASALTEAEEIELASELLEITSEQELEQFLGNVFRKVARGVGSFVKSPVGRALGGVLKNVAKKALPVVGGALYPSDGLAEPLAGTLAALRATMPRFVTLLARHRPPALRGASLGDMLRAPDRSPAQLLAYWERWRGALPLMREAPPTLAFAVFGRARVSGRLTPEGEDRLLGSLITHWALRSTLEVAGLCAVRSGFTPRPRALAPAAS